MNSRPVASFYELCGGQTTRATTCRLPEENTILISSRSCIHIDDDCRMNWWMVVGLTPIAVQRVFDYSWWDSELIVCVCVCAPSRSRHHTNNHTHNHTRTRKRAAHSAKQRSIDGARIGWCTCDGAQASGPSTSLPKRTVFQSDLVVGIGNHVFRRAAFRACVDRCILSVLRLESDWTKNPK